MQQQESSEKPAQSEDWKQTSESKTINNEGDARPRGSRRGRGGQTRGADRGGKYGESSRTHNTRNYGATEGQESRNFGNQPADSEGAYNEKPMMRGGRGNYRGRPEFKERRGDRGNRGGYEGSYTRGRGGPSRGGRGRGNRNPNYEVARPIQESELNSDEEVVYLDENQLLFVEKTQKFVATELLNAITEEQVVRICVDNEFDSKKIDSILATYQPDKKYEGCKDYQWQTPQTRQAKKQTFQEDQKRKIEQQKQYREDQRIKAENRAAYAQKKQEQKIRREKLAKDKALREEALEQQREQERIQAEEAAEQQLAEQIEEAEDQQKMLERMNPALAFFQTNEQEPLEEVEAEQEKPQEEVEPEKQNGEETQDVQAEKKAGKAAQRKQRQNRKKAEDEVAVEGQEKAAESASKAKPNKKNQERASKKPQNGSKAKGEQQWRPKEAVEEETQAYIPEQESSPTEQNDQLEANLTAQVAEIVDEDRKDSVKETKTSQQAPKHEEPNVKSQTADAAPANQTQPQMMPQMNMGMVPQMPGQMQMPMIQMPTLSSDPAKQNTPEHLIQVMQYQMMMQQQQIAFYQQMLTQQMQSQPGSQNAGSATQGSQNPMMSMQIPQGMQQMATPQFMNPGNFMTPGSQPQGNTPGNAGTGGRQGQH